MVNTQFETGRVSDLPPSRTFAAGARQQDWITFILAIWLFISPWVLQFAWGYRAGPYMAAPAMPFAALGNAAWDAWILGAVVFFVSLSALARRSVWQEWVSLILGIWIFVAPWVLGFAMPGGWAASWDHWIVGVLIFLVSFSNLSVVRQRLRGRPAV